MNSNKNNNKMILTWFKRITLFTLIPLFLIVTIISVTSGLTTYSIVNLMKKASNYQYRLTLPDSINVLEPANINGVNQWISIRAHNKNSPILLFIHGGPGFHLIRLEHEIASQWEEYFTVVFWDQRGAGKSYYPTTDIADTMTTEQMLDDTSEMIAYLRKRFNREKIFIAGHSWGSVLGIHMAKRHPDWLYAYLGISQVVHSAKSKQKTTEMLLELLKESNDQEGVETLKAIRPFTDPDLPVKTYYKNWKQVQRMLIPFGLNEFHQKDNSNMIQLFMLSALLRSHTISISEIYREIFSDDNPSTLPLLKEGVRRTDIPKQVGYKFEVPIFFVIGKHDWQVYHEMSSDYFNQISSPHKEILLLENSAHIPFIDEPGRFYNFLINRVLPATSY